MRINTFTILAGSAACNARCPYCISRMTPRYGIGFNEPKVNWRNFKKACRFAQVSGVTTILITGKGEPTLYPKQITKFLRYIKPFDFPLIELQTNGILFWTESKKYERYLREWYKLGLTMIAISIVHYKVKKNKKIFTPKSEYVNLDELINNLHKLGFSVRLSCMLIKGYIDNIDEVRRMAEYARNLGIEQLSFRKLAKPLEPEEKEVSEYTIRHSLTEKNLDKITSFLSEKGKKLMTLPHEAIIYDLNGQNICLTNALTIEPEKDDLRQIIFFPDGHLRFDWQFRGAILI